jgi:uncharacterized zinc-type alcohol dehydrogenase-like protein
MANSAAWGAIDSTSPLGPLTIERRATGPSDVRIRITHCGICHSDLHTVRSEWEGTRYPCIPGHEIVGEVVEVGADVRRHRLGDRVGVGCLVDSCRECEDCSAGLENYCVVAKVGTYNSSERDAPERNTYGGYSTEIVVTEDFVLTIPEGLDSASAAPILCAGVTTFSPLRRHSVGPGMHVGVVGLGGLGGMAVKLAKALGAEVTLITRTGSKNEDALKAGADHVLISSNSLPMTSAARSLDLILSTVPTDHDMMPYLRLLKRDGSYVVLGACEPLTADLDARVLLGARLSVTGSSIGGLPETQEVLEFCAANNVRPDVRVIVVDEVNAAYDNLASGDPGYRYVIDMTTLSSAR